ncbi:hypothetical protein PhCBS80983_g00494 [Powellomyces hirtus]|uniref:Zn(2)-C6 fungal-type domain-containing protein n=1 Tax=Powellomyces hirtus TaxID=109895 RepID=A0A507EDQ5_9FUNG|nr:hypothetical protein PhCBS80983_g00494 [Powellomyces hirtus]
MASDARLAPSGSTRRRACEPCRHRKRKCDGDRPLCGACRVFGPPESGCVYFADRFCGADHGPRPPVKGLPVSQSAEEPPGGAGKHQAKSDLSSTSPRDQNEHIAPSQNSEIVSHWEPASPPISLSETLHVNGVQVSMKLIETFFRYPGAQIPFSFLKRDVFLSSIRDQCPFLLAAMQCLAQRYAEQESPQGSDCDEGEVHYQAARDMISRLYDDHSISAVQGLLIMATCAAMRGVLSVCWQYIGMAARMAHYLALEAASVAGVTYSPIKEEVRRRTWAAVLIMERMSWLAVDRPSIFANVPARVRQHIPDSLWMSVWPDQAMKPAIHGPFEEAALFGYLRPLMVLYGKALDFARGEHGLRMVMNYQTLDAEIDMWFLSLPSAVRILLIAPEREVRRLSIRGCEPNFWFAFSVTALGLHARGVLRKWLLTRMLSTPDQVVAAASFALNAEANAPPTPVQVDANVLLCKILADAIHVADEQSALLQHGLARSASLFPATPHLCMGTYQVALVYVSALGRAISDGDHTMIARCDVGLAVVDAALGVWNRLFSPAHKLRYTLRNLHTAARQGLIQAGQHQLTPNLDGTIEFSLGAPCQ